MAYAVLAHLANAREKAVLSSFLLADQAVEDAVLKAAERGVRVYVLLASEARLGASPSEDEFEKRVVDQHKVMLARLGGHALFRSAPHFHAKIVVIDPDTNPAGILLTANLTQEALERNEEFGVTLTPGEVVEAIAYLKWAMWETAEHELIDPKDGFKATNPLGKVQHPADASAIVATTAKTNAIRDEALRLIGTAKTRIIVSSFGWDADHRVVQELCARAREGLEVTVLARLRPTSMPALLALAEAGASVYAFPWLHAKAIWTDSGEALVMSANLQVDGLDQGFELGIRMADNRAAELCERLLAWQNVAPWRLLPHPRLGELQGKTKLWRGGRFEDVEVKDTDDVILGTVTAASADMLDMPRPPLPKGGPLPLMAHELRYSWTVVPPSLASNSKEQRRPAKGTELTETYVPPVFREPSGRVVVAVRSSFEVERARRVMTEVGAEAIVLAQSELSESRPKQGPE